MLLIYVRRLYLLVGVPECLDISRCRNSCKETVPKRRQCLAGKGSIPLM